MKLMVLKLRGEIKEERIIISSLDSRTLKKKHQAIMLKIFSKNEN